MYRLVDSLSPELTWCCAACSLCPAARRATRSPGTRCGSSCWCCRARRSRAPVPAGARRGCCTRAGILQHTSSDSCCSATMPGTGWRCCWEQRLSEYSDLLSEYSDSRDFFTCPGQSSKYVIIYLFLLLWFMNFPAGEGLQR